MTAENTAGDVTRSGSASVVHVLLFYRSQLASARVAVKNLTLPEGKLAAPFTSIFFPAILASNWPSASFTRSTISVGLMPSNGFVPSRLLMITWLGRNALMIWFDGGGSGARFDVIVNPSAAASAQDRGFAGRLFVVGWDVGCACLDVVRALSCCSSLSNLAVESFGPCSLASKALSLNAVSCIVMTSAVMI